MNEETIFSEALERSGPQERASFLQHACSGDAALRLRVEALLSAYGAGEFLESPATGLIATIDIAAPGDLDELIGTQIGPYKLLERIGEGGMGVVYMAQQTQPVKRKVALKLIKPGMDSRQVVARFEAERQALALMDHPNIARIFDAGTVGPVGPTGSDGVESRGKRSPGPAGPTGRPYFVMELVRGLAITEYCDRENLNIRRRLELFIDVCRAVQHAHQKGIIHRDLKPSNVLVTLHDGRPVVKVIDFGVAKALNQELTERTLFTQFAQMIGTPLYMSPEQAELSGLDVDTRSDVYSLGVLLYELLTGTTPFDKETLAKLGLDELRRLIREQEPQRPSARLSTLNANNRSTISLRRSSDPRKLRQLVRGELDWIVMKAMEKDRNRRYESASDLADDVQHYLDDLPIVARRPTWRIRLQKWCRRHPVSTLAVAVSLLLFTGVAAGGYWHSSRLADALETSTRLHNEGLQRERALRQELYASDIRRAWSAAKNGDRTEARCILQLYRPEEGQEDIRGFEWGYLWRLTQAPLRTLRGHEADLLTADVSPDDRFIASGDRGGTVKIWELATGAEATTLRYSDQEVTSVRFSPDGKLLATAGQDRTIRLWDVETWTEAARLEQHERTVTCVAWSPDGKRLASSGRDNRVHVWNAAKGIVEATLPEHSDVVRCLAWSANGQWLATADGTRGVQLWETKRWQLRRSLASKGRAILAIAFSTDSRRMAYSGYGGIVWLVELAGLSEVGRAEARGNVWSLGFAETGDLIVGTSFDCALLRYSAWDKQLHWLREGIGESPAVRAAVTAGNGAMLVTASEEGRTINVWDTLGLFGCREPTLFDQGVPLTTGPIKGATTSEQLPLDVCRLEDGSVVAACNGTYAARSERGHLLALQLPREDHAVAIWDVRNWQLRQCLTAPGVPLGQLAFSADNQWLAAGGSFGMAGIWNLRTGTWRELIAPDPSASDNCRNTYVASSPAENLLATAYHPGTQVTLWRPERKEPVKVLSTTSTVEQLAIDASGRILAVGEHGRVMSLWDIASGARLGELRGHEWDDLHSMTFSPDGRTFASSSPDGTTRLWHVETRRELFPILQYSAPMGLCFPDSRQLVGFAGDKVLSFEGHSGN